MPVSPAALLIVGDSSLIAGIEPGLRARGWVVRSTPGAEGARSELGVGHLQAVAIHERLADDDAGAFAAEVRALSPDTVLVLMVDRLHPDVLRLAGSFDDVFLVAAQAEELDVRLRIRLAEGQRAGRAHQRERFLRGVVRVADMITPHADVPTIAGSLALALLGLPGVEGVRVEIDAETLGDPPLVVLEVGQGAAGVPGEFTVVPLRGLAGGRLRLVHRTHQQLDPEVADALGAIVGAALSGARQFAALKERQLRLERGYVDRHRKLSRVSGRLERLSEARDSFLALLSHDLRSPLAVVLGQVQLMEEGLVAPGAMPRVAGIIRRQGDRMVQMVEELLDRYRRDDAVRSVSDQGDAVRIVNDMVENLRPLAAARRQTLTLTAPDAAPIEADIASIREVLANLIENAVRYSPEGSTITVDVEVRESKAHVSIHDAGPGFGSRLATGGSGAQIGLRASSRIVADAGGSLRTSSAPGGGGLAVVALPLAVPQAAASALEVYVAEPVLRAQLVGLLSQHWEVRAFDSLGGAIDRMRRQPPAVVVLDQAIDAEAIAFVRRLKADAELAAAPVLAVGDDAGELYDAGVLAVVRRPLDGPLLLSHVRRALRLLGELPAPGDGALDVLTGLSTAATLVQRLDHALTIARTAGAQLPVVLVRIDDLRQINRQQGWLVGDQLLLWLANQLREHVRPGELAARVDAESFALALPGRSFADAERLAADLQDTIGRARPRLGVARVEVRVSAQALDLTTLALGGEFLVGAVRVGRES